MPAVAGCKSLIVGKTVYVGMPDDSQLTQSLSQVFPSQEGWLVTSWFAKRVAIRECHMIRIGVTCHALAWHGSPWGQRCSQLGADQGPRGSAPYTGFRYGNSSIKRFWHLCKINLLIYKASICIIELIASYIQMLEWLAYSPDLNPIEHIKSWIKAAIRRFVLFRMPYRLITYLQLLIKSIPQHYQAVIEVNGGNIWY